MKMSKVLIMLCSVLLFTACGSDDDDYTKLSVDLKDLSLSFTAQATESFTVTVDTDQETWAVQSDKNWCKVEKKGLNQFVVTAEPNESQEAPETATITITATGAKPILISVMQVALTAEEMEQMLYDRYVTPEMRTAIAKLNIPINRGINPPNIEGYYRMETNLTATTMPNDLPMGTRFNDFKFNFHNQSGLLIDLLGYEVGKDTDIYSTEHTGSGTFISGEGDKFSIFMDEQVLSDGYTRILLSIISGEVARSGSSITGIKDIRYSIIMKDTGGNPNVMRVGEGRMFKDDEAPAITKEQFETLVRSASLKSSSSDFGIPLFSNFK